MISALPYSPTAGVSAADEYLIRDKWGYCTTANYAESEHFVIFYGNNDTTGQVNEAFLKKIWKPMNVFGTAMVSISAWII